MKRLTPQAIKLIKTSGLLHGRIADLIGVSPASLKDILNVNDDDRLTDDGVLVLIKNHLAEMQDMVLVEESQVV